MRTRILGAGLACCALILTGCGGGGDDGGTTPPPPQATTFTIGGTLSGLAANTSLVLQNNGASNLTVGANGAFTFTAPVNSGAGYAVTVTTQPDGQTCVVASGTGTATANVTGVTVTCSANTAVTYTVGGTLSGLASGANVVLQNNGASDLTVSADGGFTFAAPVNSGAGYAVTVATQPAGQTCTVASGSGTATANVTAVTVTCAANPVNTYTIGGSVSGLASGASVVLQNNAASDLTVSADGGFTFAAPVNSGSTYAVTVLTQPAGQTCSVASGSGTATANVTGVAVTCAMNDTTAPTISSHTPLPRATGAAVTGGVVAVTFSEAMDPASLTTTSLTLSGPEGVVAGAVALEADNTRAVFTPASRLRFDADYTATVTVGVKDVAGNALATQASWKFNTGKALAVGQNFTCARLPDGRVKCWGDNTYGQLGYDDILTRGNHPTLNTTQTLAAVNLGIGRTAVAIAAADYHACAILDDGSAKCWGRNNAGQLGQGVITGDSVAIGDVAGEMAALQPIDFGPGRRVLEISLGQLFTCARLDDATLKCWGDNSRAQLGRGNVLPLGVAPGDIAAAAPVALGTGLTPVLVSLGHYHACVILEDASAARVAKCWGDNNWGQAGRGDTDRVGNEPAEMGNGLLPISFGAGRSPQYLMATGGHSCALLDDQSTKCWGLNTWGQVGLAAGNGMLLTDTEVARRTCNGGLGPTLPLACIGEQAGEMGDALPAAIGAGNTTRLSIGYRHNCALRTTGGLLCWGSNEEGQLGIGSGGVLGTSASIIGDEPNEHGLQAPTLLKAARTVEELSAGGFHTCVLYTDGSINCWGHNNRGQLGRNDAELKVGDAAPEMGDALVDVNLGT